MNKEEIKHFKSLLRQGSLRHMNILLDDKFQKELLTIIKDYEKLQQENQRLKDKLSKIETLIINHNCDTGDIYYKYNSRFLKSELKQRILEIVYEEGNDSDE